MFQVSSLDEIIDSLNSDLFNFTIDSYFSKSEESYKQRIYRQRTILKDKNKQRHFIANFRHPASPSIIGEMQSIVGCPINAEGSLKLKLFYLASRFFVLHPFYWAERDFISWNYSRFKYLASRGIRRSSMSLTGNPSRQNDKGFVWNMRWLRYLYFVGQLESLIGEDMSSIKRVIDLGGCYGGFMALLATGRTDMTLTLVEFSENIPLAAYYLSMALPQYTINIINSSEDVAQSEPGQIYLVPAHISSHVLDKEYDLFCNHVSLGEMSREHFDNYVSSKAYVSSRYKHIVNRVSSNPNPALIENDRVIAWKNSMNFLDYDLSDIIYFDIFPFCHFFPLHESRRFKSQLVTPLKTFRSWLPLWKRSPVTSQCFEVLTKRRE